MPIDKLAKIVYHVTHDDPLLSVGDALGELCHRVLWESSIILDVAGDVVNLVALGEDLNDQKDRAGEGENEDCKPRCIGWHFGNLGGESLPSEKHLEYRGEKDGHSQGRVIDA